MMSSVLRYSISTLREIGLHTPKTRLPNDLWLMLRNLKIAKATRRSRRGGIHEQRSIKPIVSQRSDIFARVTSRKANHENLISISTQRRARCERSQLPKVLLCNPRSLNNKLEDLQTVLENNSIDVAAVSKTWFSSNAPTELLNLSGFDLFSRPRIDRRGGGVALYVKQYLNAALINDIPVPQLVEGLWVSLRPCRLLREIPTIAMGVFYHPPSSPLGPMLLDHIGTAVDNLLTRQPNTGVIILGDFNRLDLTPSLQTRWSK